MQGNERKCYLIDDKFCKVTKMRIAAVMGKIASLEDFDGQAEILDELAEIRNFFHWLDLRGYSDRLKDSIDMDGFIDDFLHPEKPVCQRQR